MFDIKLFGETIRKMRKNKKFSLVYVSSKINISCTYLGEIERGNKTPSIGIILAIANFFKIGLDNNSLKHKQCNPIIHNILYKTNRLNAFERIFLYKTLIEFIAFNKWGKQICMIVFK